MAEGGENGLLRGILWLNDKGLIFDKEQLTGPYRTCCDCTITSGGLADVKRGI